MGGPAAPGGVAGGGHGPALTTVRTTATPAPPPRHNPAPNPPLRHHQPPHRDPTKSTRYAADRQLSAIALSWPPTAFPLRSPAATPLPSPAAVSPFGTPWVRRPSAHRPRSHRAAHRSSASARQLGPPAYPPHCGVRTRSGGAPDPGRTASRPRRSPGSPAIRSSSWCCSSAWCTWPTRISARCRPSPRWSASLGRVISAARRVRVRSDCPGRSIPARWRNPLRPVRFRVLRGGTWRRSRCASARPPRNRR